MSKVDGGFSLIALLDGTTINGYARVDNMPLTQRYTKGSNKFTPDFEQTTENKRPVVVAILRDVTDGKVLPPNNIKYFYNSTELTFGPDNLCNTAGFEGVFKKVTDYQASVGAATYPMTALRVMKNLVPLSGYDSDRISIQGSVETCGQVIAFSELSTDVTIEESNGNQYDIIISNDKGSALTTVGETLTENLEVYRDGVKVTDLAGFTFQWVKVTATGDVNLGTAQTQTISTDDVDNVLKIRCDVLQSGSIIASGYDEVTDFSDPYYVEFKYEGITGNVVRKDQTATVTPQAIKRSSGEVEATITNWTFAIKDNEGKDFVLTNKSSHTFSGPNCQISYADIQRAKMGITGYVSANMQ